MDILFDQRSFDIQLTEGTDGFDLEIIESTADDLMQRLFIKFKTFARDLFWNQSYGIDFLNDVFGDGRPKNTVDVIIRNEIELEPLVLSLDYFESEVVDYTYACKFRVTPITEEQSITYYILTTESGLVLTNENGDTLTLRL